MTTEFDFEGAVSAADGSFEFGLRGASARLLARSDGYGPSEAVEVACAPGSAVDGVELRLCESGRVVGRVLDPEGRPVAGADVSVWRERMPVSPRGGASGLLNLSDADGRFALEDLPAGTLTILADAPGRDGAYTEAAVMLAAHATAQVELRFERMTSLRVRATIRRGGRPMECWIVVRSGDTRDGGRSGPDGRLELQLARPGVWQAILGADGDASDPAHPDLRRTTLDVPEGGIHDLELDFDALPRASSLDELGK